MAVIRKKDMKKLNQEELSEKLKELKLELTKDMANVEVGGSVKNPGRLREIRKTIARILTEQSKKQEMKKR